MKKKIIAVLISISLVFSMSVPAFAAEQSTDDTVISFETFYEALRSEYEKFGITFEVIERTDPDFVYTQGLLDNKIAEIRETMLNSHVMESTGIEIVDSSIASNSITPYSYMPAEITYQHLQLLQCPAAGDLAWATICLEVVALVDGQYDDLMSIISYSSFQKGPYLNFVSWTQRSITVDPNYYNNSIWASVTGLMTVEYTDPYIGMLVGYTSEHTISHTFYC